MDHSIANCIFRLRIQMEKESYGALRQFGFDTEINFINQQKTTGLENYSDYSFGFVYGFIFSKTTGRYQIGTGKA